MDNEWNLSVEDNGKGFDQNEKAKGIGLKNISHRTQALGGSFNIESQADRGAMFTVVLPKENLYAI